MGEAKDTFYRRLQHDYRLLGTDSVIYRFIQEEQERLYRQFRPGSSVKKGSSLIQLRLHFDALAAGRETPVEYIANLLRILSGRPVLYQDCAGTDPRGLLATLAATGLRDGDEAVSVHGSRRHMQECLSELVRRFDRQDADVYRRYAESNYAQPPYEALRELTHAILRCAAHVEVKAFFYDAGYPLNDNSYGNIPEKNGGRKPRRQSAGGDNAATDAGRGRKPRVDKTLSLLDAYCAAGHLSLFHSGAEASLEDCKRLYELLVQGDNEKVLVPLRVDSRTGCALYIVGRNFYANMYAGIETMKRAKNYRNSHNACAYGILQLDSTTDDLPLGYTLSDWFDAYTSLEEAIVQYENVCIDTLAEIREDNEELPPGSPAVFAIYRKSTIPEVTPKELAMAYEEEQAEYELYCKMKKV